MNSFHRGLAEESVAFPFAIVKKTNENKDFETERGGGPPFFVKDEVFSARPGQDGELSRPEDEGKFPPQGRKADEAGRGRTRERNPPS